MGWALLLAQYGFPLAIELARIIEEKGNPTSADFMELARKYGGKSATDYLREDAILRGLLVPNPDSGLVNLTRKVEELKGAVLEKPVLNNPVLVNPSTVGHQ